jgi:hypothetical protein
MFEALFGALYLQEDDVGRGLQQCNDFLVRIIERHIDFVQIIIEDTNYKDQLLRKFQALYHVPPRYKEITVVGPPHDRIFTMGVLDPSDKILATATARNKKVAEQEASRLALDMLEPSLTSSVPTVPAHMIDETPLVTTPRLPSPIRAAGGAGAKAPSSPITSLPSIGLVAPSKTAPIKRIVTHRPKIPVEELE